MVRASTIKVAQGLADRAAIAIDNARLYQEAREAVKVREDVVAIVSHDSAQPPARHLTVSLDAHQTRGAG